MADRDRLADLRYHAIGNAIGVDVITRESQSARLVLRLKRGCHGSGRGSFGC